MYQLLENYIRERAFLTEEEIDSIKKCFSSVMVSKKEILLEKGDTCRYYYFVNKGLFRIYSVNDDGEETTRYFAFEGAFGTALPSFIEQSPAFEYIQALENSHLIKISYQDLYSLVNKSPAFNLIYRKILELSFIESQKRT